MIQIFLKISADLICEKKKLSKSTIPSIKGNLESNIKLILLDTQNLPQEVLDKMNQVYETTR
jgi:hypothetical protein